MSREWVETMRNIEPLTVRKDSTEENKDHISLKAKKENLVIGSDRVSGKEAISAVLTVSIKYVYDCRRTSTKKGEQM
jgi:hypothetical protein